MTKKLTKSQVDHYFEHGYCAPIDIMSEQEAATLKSRLELAEARYGEAINANNRNNAHLVFTFLDEIAFNPGIVDAVEDLLGPDILLWGTVLFIKESQSSGFVSWHQDATYMGLEPHDFLTPWLALSPSNPESGCMRVIPGSHHAPIRPHQDTFGENNILTRGQQIDQVDPDDAVDLILRPGQLSIHHPRLIHGSSPNLSNHRRVGVALQAYMKPSVRQVIGEGYAVHVRGEDNFGHCELGDRPQTDMDEKNIAWRDKVNQNWSDLLYRDAGQKRTY